MAWSSARASLADQAYEAIRGEILRGQLRPGTPLSRRRLALEMGMSVIPVTDALRRLEGDGLVESRNGDGIFFPLHESAAMSANELGAALDDLLGQVVDHVGQRVNDDLALVLVERRDGVRSPG